MTISLIADIVLVRIITSPLYNIVFMKSYEYGFSRYADSGEQPELPAVMALPFVLRKATADILGSADKLDSNGQGYTSFSSDRVPKFAIGLREADSLRPMDLAIFDGLDRLSFHLFNDGSPFVYKKDLQKYPSEFTEYSLICLEEQKPFIVYGSRLEIASSQLRAEIDDYLIRARDAKEPPVRFLDEKDALAFITFLQTTDLRRFMETEDNI